ncbi:cobaltochelatase subunit CobN [cyanobiont of Ornithocercus magnificus]|nr:cobaltochelatase subunit CobN [cyanobiont of Ornithocercus magnificus]
MHRIATLPGSGPPDSGDLVEQPPAKALFLTSALSDISSLAATLRIPAIHQLWRNGIRALPLSALSHPAQVDHYLSTTAQYADVVIIRLLGGRSHWNYGLEQVRRWQEDVSSRVLVVLAGTPDQDKELHDLGSIDPGLAGRLAELLRIGGTNNLVKFLEVVSQLQSGARPLAAKITPQPMADPQPWDWQQEPGPRVGVILYRALYQSGDTEAAKALLAALRRSGIAPRTLWVSSLRDTAVQNRVLRFLQRESVDAVITATSFASVQFEDAGMGSPLWDMLGVPVLQLLSSGRSYEQWRCSSQGIDPLDLCLQVVLPELDGRVTTRVGSFRSIERADASLATAVHRLRPDATGLNWIASHAAAWCDLRHTPPELRRLALILANYPVRDGRIANGVGLDTPASIVSILHWLKTAGYQLGSLAIPQSGDALMHKLLEGRTNDLESRSRPPLDYLSIGDYLNWWRTLSPQVRTPIQSRWGNPEQAIDLEDKGFPIHGLRFGHIVILIQPSRGYDPDAINDLHSPDLPPPHRYLAQYLWLRCHHKMQLMVHVGKHGSAEWLPGKSVGLSEICAPSLALGAIPHLYPFIVNDPGEGSQAKRRGHAVILDHLTPPLARADLYGGLQKLEDLLEEYLQVQQLGAERKPILEQKLQQLLKVLNWPGSSEICEGTQGWQSRLHSCLETADAYLCELREAQIRTGLHCLGNSPDPQHMLDLLLSLARCPQAGEAGLTQAMATALDLELDPWSDEEGNILTVPDQQCLREIGIKQPRCIGHGVAWLEEQALKLVNSWLDYPISLGSPHVVWSSHPLPDCQRKRVLQELWPRLVACGNAEREAFLAGVAGQRLRAGPSGAPTRGRPEVLPTGRNFYSVDLRGLPTESAWDLGRRSASQLLELHLQEEGEHLLHLALSVWGTATMRNGGEDIAQLLALLGVWPVWDGPSRRIVDLELIPLSSLGRPRVDVVLRISGLFRDAFPQLVSWVHRAQAMVAALDEPAEMNPLAALQREVGHQNRIYGSAPGAYGAGLQTLIDGGNWNERHELGEAFLAWSAWSYDENVLGQHDPNGLRQNLRRVQAVLHNQDNREHDLLDSDDYYQFHGGLSAAVESSGGNRPRLWFADHSRMQRLRLHSLEKEIDKVVRSRLLNPRWINGMREHGYKGGFELSASLDYLFAYDAATDRVPDWCYGALFDAWLADCSTRDFLERRNPWALRDMAERLLEASNRGLWQGADTIQLEALQNLILSSEARIEQGGFSC